VTDSPSPGTPAPAPRSASPLALVGFVLIMAALLVIALIGRLQRPQSVTGLPEGAEVRAALAELAGGLHVTTVDLRFESSLHAADSVGFRPPVVAGFANQRIEAAERHLLAARRLTPRDPRLAGWLGHLELARHRYERAERQYRAAIDLAPHYGEARLGLGVTLAMMARTESDPSRGRARTLEAIAQLAAVAESDPFYRAALYDRIVLLSQAEREPEARKWAERYLELEPAGPWAASLARMFPARP